MNLMHWGILPLAAGAVIFAWHYHVGGWGLVILVGLMAGTGEMGVVIGRGEAGKEK